MTVKVTSFTGNLWDYVHDDYRGGNDGMEYVAHSGQLDSATVVYVIGPGGEPNHNIAVVPCPEDSGVTSWPVGGGIDARLGQMLHLRLLMDTMAQDDALSVLKVRIEETDGPDRYCLTDADIAEVTNG